MALYRSKRRDEPRVFEPFGLSPPDFKPQSGIFHYSPQDKPFSETYAQAIIHNQTVLSKKYSEESRSIIECCDDLYIHASKYIGLIYNWPDSLPNPSQHVIFPCFHKTLLNLYSSHQLTMSGQYGIARPLLRQSFESLLIAKFCSSSPESDVFDRWIDGEDLYFTNAVIKKISIPSTDEFRIAWKVLCEWSHSTIYASQPHLGTTEAEQEASLNFAFTVIFLQWSFHLLNRHIVTPSVRYYGNRYKQTDTGEKAIDRLKRNFKWQSQMLGKASRRLIRDYKSTWKIIQSGNNDSTR